MWCIIDCAGSLSLSIYILESSAAFRAASILQVDIETEVLSFSQLLMISGREQSSQSVQTGYLHRISARLFGYSRLAWRGLIFKCYLESWKCLKNMFWSCLIVPGCVVFQKVPVNSEGPGPGPLGPAHWAQPNWAHWAYWAHLGQFGFALVFVLVFALIFALVFALVVACVVLICLFRHCMCYLFVYLFKPNLIGRPWTKHE